MTRTKRSTKRPTKPLRPKDDYPIVIFYSEEDECYIADLPDLRYCSAFGDTPEQALQEILIAKKLWLQVAVENGCPLPERRYKVPQP